MKDPYLPIPIRIDGMVFENEARDIKTFRLVFTDEPNRIGFSFLPGQFAELSLMGAGECPIGIASSPTEPDHLLLTVKRAGIATTALHRSSVGDIIGIRGPLGNTFPIPAMEGKSIVIVGGGFAFTTLRSMIKYVLAENNRGRFNDLTVIYGARNPGELLYKSELEEWEGRKDLKVLVTVDKGDDRWTRHIGVVPNVLRTVAPAAKDATVLVCGPPIMVRYTLPVLADLGFKPESIFLSLEMRMKCGIGQCGRCNIGPKYVCKDGPVFSFAELQQLPQEY